MKNQVSINALAKRRELLKKIAQTVYISIARNCRKFVVTISGGIVDGVQHASFDSKKEATDWVVFELCPLYRRAGKEISLNI